MDDMTRIFKQQPDKIESARKVDDYIGSLLSDVAGFIVAEDYRRATQAAGYLLVALAKKAGAKPFKVLRVAYKAS